MKDLRGEEVTCRLVQEVNEKYGHLTKPVSEHLEHVELLLEMDEEMTRSLWVSI